jgi:hypothetical protein
MQKHNLDSASLELNNLETVLSARVTNSLEAGDILDVARGLIALDKEAYKTEEEARKLRLTGQPDAEIYTALNRGYRRLHEKVNQLMKKDNHSQEISTLYRALRFTDEAQNLAEYLREVNE